MATSHYFDPDTNMIWMYKDSELNNVVGASADFQLGLEDFSDLNDVKIKVLSVEYKVKTFTDNLATSSADNNIQAFNNESRQAGGNFVFGVKNVSETTIINDLTDFKGTSAWPVHITSFITQVGLPASATKTWKPGKTAFSDEQVAFITVRNNSGVHSSNNCISWASITIRAIRL